VADFGQWVRPSPYATMRGMKLLLLITLEACYGILGFMLYHARRLYQDSSALENDLIVLYGPFFVAVAIATYLFQHWADLD
jgi:hypothetical protein